MNDNDLIRRGDVEVAINNWAKVKGIDMHWLMININAIPAISGEPVAWRGGVSEALPDSEGEVSIFDVTYSTEGKDEWDIADDVINEAYPDTNNKGKGKFWGEQRIPNSGILRGAIVKALSLTTPDATKQINEAYEKDAVRYCWLREADEPQMELMTRHYGNELDEEIDKALIRNDEGKP